MGARPAAGSPGDASGLARSFERADQGCGPVPIWWRSGGRLEPARLRGQMEQLRAQGVTQAVVMCLAPAGALYSSLADDPTDPGDSVLPGRGKARGSAEVLVNQISAVRLTLSPYQTNITAYLRPGALLARSPCR